MPWVMLFLAGLLETAWAVGLRYSDGFTRPGPSLWTAVTMAASVYLLAQAVRSLPLGTAYAVWTGIGAVGAMVYSISYFNEPATLPRIACVALIITGIAGLGWMEH